MNRPRVIPVRDRIKTYLATLSPQARAMLVRAAETAQQRGEQDASLDAVLGIIQEIDGPPAATTPPLPLIPPAPVPAPAPVAAPPAPAPVPATRAASVTPAESVRVSEEALRTELFRSLEPFLIDMPIEERQVGVVASSSLSTLWTFFRRDLMPAAFHAVLFDPVTAPIGAQPHPDARGVAERLRPRIAETTRSYLADMAQIPRGMQRVRGLVGGEAGLGDLLNVVELFETEARYTPILPRLPRLISNFEAAEPGPMFDVLRNALQKQCDVRFLATVMVKRMANPAYLANVAIRLCGSQDPRAVQQSEFAGIIEILLLEIDRAAYHCERLGTLPGDAPQLISHLRLYHEMIRHFSVVFELDLVPEWMQRVAAARRRISDLLDPPIAEAPGLVRRLLRDAAERPGVFDPSLLDDADRALTLFDMARVIADSIALNDAIARTRKALEQTLELLHSRTIEGLRKAGPDRRAGAVKLADAAIRYCGIVFGEEYASVVRRSRDTALQKTPGRSSA